jgi:23S rRNA (adenine2503-C2)-methyltransferase
MSGKVPEVNLVFDEPVQRKKAPKHLADFSPAERKALAKELGFEAFRATQVATHYFSHLSSNP